MKDVEHILRPQENQITDYFITRSDKKPKDWADTLKSSTFKKFSSNSSNIRQILKGHMVYLAVNEVCYLYTGKDDELKCVDLQESLPT